MKYSAGFIFNNFMEEILLGLLFIIFWVLVLIYSEHKRIESEHQDIFPGTPETQKIL